LEHEWIIFHSVGNFIPTAIFRGVGQPPTRNGGSPMTKPQLDQWDEALHHSLATIGDEIGNDWWLKQCPQS